MQDHGLPGSRTQRFKTIPITQALLSALGSELGRCLFLPGSFLSLIIIPRMRVGYEMVDSQRGATRRVSLL